MPRIDRVRLENHYRQYPSKTPPTGIKEEERIDPLLKTDEKGVIYEPSSVEREAPRVKEENREEPGKELGALNAEDAERTIPELFKEIGLRILRFFRGVISNIWNGPAAEEVTDAPPDEAGNGEAPDAAAEESINRIEPPAENRLEQIIAEHDLEQLVRYVTENGEKKPARSTDLLTIYNRYGRVNRIDPSDRKKILEGNFHDIQL